MNNLLNLDEIVPDVKAIVLKGTRHEMREITVEEYLQKVREAKTVAKGAEAETLTPDEQVEKTVDMIVEAFPTMNREDLVELTLSKLTKILDFVLAKPEDIEAQVKAAQGNG